jgi:hypothetical protein
MARGREHGESCPAPAGFPARGEALENLTYLVRKSHVSRQKISRISSENLTYLVAATSVSRRGDFRKRW